MSDRAFVFPGQGSQAVGMGKALADASAAAREVFEEVDEALGQHLSRLMFDGPMEELTLTENAQPALMAVSLAVVRMMEKEGNVDLSATGRFVAGHSLGEYSALAAAGAFTIADTARLLKARGKAMQAAVPVGEGAMAALLGVDLPVAQEIAEAAAEGEVCVPANDNAPGQVVLSGHTAAIDRAVEVAPDMGARRAMRLQVSAPFHCPLMQPAAEAMAAELANVPPVMPHLPLVANVTASQVSDAATITDLLVQQVTGMVRWRECCRYMAAEGVATLVEIGAGKVLTGMARRIHEDLSGVAINGPDDIEAFLGTL